MLNQVLRAEQLLLLKLDSHIAFLQSPQVELFHLGGIRCKCSGISTRQRCGGTCAVYTCICLVQSNTGVGILHAHLSQSRLSTLNLSLQSHDTAFSLCVLTLSKRTRNATLELLFNPPQAGLTQCPADILPTTCHRLHQTLSLVPASRCAGPAVLPTAVVQARCQMLRVPSVSPNDTLLQHCSATNVWRQTKSATCDDSDEDVLLT